MRKCPKKVFTKFKNLQNMKQKFGVDEDGGVSVRGSDGRFTGSNV